MIRAGEMSLNCKFGKDQDEFQSHCNCGGLLDLLISCRDQKSPHISTSLQLGMIVQPF